MPPLINLKNKVFGSLLVRCRADDRVRPSGSKVPQWYCVCLCGKVVLVEGGDLRTGTTKTCGCHYHNFSGHRNKTHGESSSSEYSIWCGIHRRCYNKKDRYYKNYGGRGISVCNRWNRNNPDGIKNFILDMGRRPNLNYTIERKDVNGIYSPKNCIWILASEQCKNKTVSRKHTYKGITLIQSEWSKILSVYPGRIQYHLWAGKDFEETVNFLINKSIKRSLGLINLLKGETGYAF